MRQLFDFRFRFNTCLPVPIRDRPEINLLNF